MRKRGYFDGGYSLIPIGPRIFHYSPMPGNPLRYTTSDGRQFTIGEQFETDLATIPRLFWPLKGLSPLDWIPAAILHDWLWELHHDGVGKVGFRESNRIMCDAIYSLGWSYSMARLCKLAVDCFGWPVWSRTP